MTGLAAGIVMLGFARSGSAIGKAVNDPTHNSLLADWFDPDHRPKVYSFHRAGQRGRRDHRPDPGRASWPTGSAGAPRSSSSRSRR